MTKETHKRQYRKHEAFKNFLDDTNVDSDAGPSQSCRVLYPDWYATVVHAALCHLLCYYHIVRGKTQVKPEHAGDREYLDGLPDDKKRFYLRLQQAARHTLYYCGVVRAQDAECAYQTYPALREFFLTPAV